MDGNFRTMIKRFLSLAACFSLCFFTHACSSDDSQVEEAIENAQDEIENEIDDDQQEQEDQQQEEDLDQEELEEEELAEADENVIEPEVNELPTSGSVATTPSAVPLAEGRVVRYVKSGKVNVLNAPNGQAVNSLAKGETIVVNYEGEWARLDNGTYVAANALTATPTGYAKESNSWK